MKVVYGLILVTGYFILATSQTYEEDVESIVSAFYDQIEKGNSSLGVTPEDFNSFFCQFESEVPEDCEDIFIDENEFAVGWLKIFNGTEEEAARGLFKRFDTTRIETVVIYEGITEDDVEMWYLYLDVDENGALDEFEFNNGFSLLQYDLFWGIMFVKYRFLIGQVSDYSDGISYSEHEDIYNDMDADGSGDLTKVEMVTFMANEKYATSNTTSSWFDILNLPDFIGEYDDVIDGFEWLVQFRRLDFWDPEDILTYDEFLWLDRAVRPVTDWKSLKEAGRRDI